MIAPHRGIESLKVAARWPGADRVTVVTLATRLASVRADAEGYAYFQEQADAHPDQALPLALAGFFQARLGPIPAPLWPSWTRRPRRISARRNSSAGSPSPRSRPTAARRASDRRS